MEKVEQQQQHPSRHHPAKKCRSCRPLVYAIVVLLITIGRISEANHLLKITTADLLSWRILGKEDKEEDDKDGTLTTTSAETNLLLRQILSTRINHTKHPFLGRKVNDSNNNSEEANANTLLYPGVFLAMQKDPGITPKATVTVRNTSTSNGTEITLRAVTTDSTTTTTPQSKKPKFILHVGLPKTGTTFLQCALCSQVDVTEPIFLKDNWVFLGTCPYKACRTKRVPEKFLEHYRGAFLQDGQSRDVKINKYGPVPHTMISATTTETKKRKNKNRRGELKQDDESNNEDGESQNIWMENEEQEEEHPEALTSWFRERVRQLRQDGRNVLVVFEGLHNLDDGQIRIMAEFLEQEQDWDVQVLVVYRPLYEWLPSKYNSIVKQKSERNNWPGVALKHHPDVVGGHILPFDLDNRGDFTKLVQFIEMTQQHPAETTLHNFALYFSNVSVIPLHNLPPVQTEGVDSILNYLFCVLLETPLICDAVHAQLMGGNNLPSNPSITINYDLLATAAYQIGILNNGTNNNNSNNNNTEFMLDRHRVRVDIQKRQQKILKRTPNDFPLKCLPNKTLIRLETLSLNVEQKLFRESWTRESEFAHRNGFAKNVAKRTYCWIDTDQTLADPSWRAYLMSLRPRRKRKQPATELNRGEGVETVSGNGDNEDSVEDDGVDAS